MKQRKPLSVPIFITVYACVIAACVLLDQLTKHFIEIAVNNHGGKINIIGEWLTLVWTVNTGATGGLFSWLAWRNWLFFVMTLVGLPAFGFMLWRSRTRSVWGQIAFAFVTGGTIGNAIDRLFMPSPDGKFFGGGVRDFVRVEGFFGIFNIADSFLVVGVILAILSILFFDYDSLLKTLLNDRKQRQAAGDACNGNTDGNTDAEPTSQTNADLKSDDALTADEQANEHNGADKTESDDETD